MNKSQTFKEVSEEIVSIYGKLIKQNTKSNFIDCAKELETEFDKIYEVFDVDSDNINKFSEINKKIEIFISQILDIMKKLMPTAFVGATTYLITKNILKPEEKEEIEDESDEEDLEKESEGTEIASETEESSIQSLDETDKQ